MEAVVFDLDGTLWNACGASAEGWTRGLALAGVERVVTAQEIANVAGKPYRECVESILPALSRAEIDDLLPLLDREEKKVIQRRGGQLYPGVREGVERLSLEGRVFVVSNCQEWYLEEFLTHSGLGQFFLDVECHGRTGRVKSDNLRLVMERNQLSRAVYVGDTEGDQRAAREAEMDFVHVDYGFGQCHEALTFGSFPALVDHFLDLQRR